MSGHSPPKHDYSDNDGYPPPNHVQGGMEHLPLRSNNQDSAEQTSMPPQRTKAKEAHIQSSTQEGHVHAWRNLPSDTILRNMVTRRVKAPINQPQEKVHLMSLEHKGRVLAKGNLVANAPYRNIGGTPLGPAFVGVYVLGLESFGTHKGDELLPRPIFDMLNIRDAVGSVIAWPKTHVINATSSDAPKIVRSKDKHTVE